MAWFGTWKYRIPFTIDSSKIDADLTHFPLALQITDPAVFTELGANKLKIAVTDESGNALYAEIEMWEEGNNKALLHISGSDWIIPSNADAKIYLYFDSEKPDNTDFVAVSGSRPEVWDSGFAAVYTMSQDPSLGGACILDSTSNANHGTTQGSMTNVNLVNGLLGKAIELNGIGQRIKIPHSASLNIYEHTITVLLNTDNISERIDNRFVIAKRNTDTGVGFEIYERRHTNSGYKDWVYYGLSFDRIDAYQILTAVSDIDTYVDFYLNDTKQTRSAVTDIRNTEPLYLGSSSRENDTYAFDGVFEHVSISNIARSDAWIKAVNHALRNEILSMGSQEELRFYYVAGNVWLGAEGQTALARDVSVIAVDDDALLGRTTSSAVDGAFAIENIPTAEDVDVIIHDTDGQSYNDLIFRVTPEPMP